MEQLKLLSITAAVTTLIWATADSLVNETATIVISLEVVAAPGNPDMLVDMPERDISYQVQLSGPRRAMAVVKTRDPSLPIRLQIDSSPTGEKTVDLKQILSDQLNEFAQLVVQSVDPSTVTLVVDRMVSQEAPISLLSSTLTYDVEPQAAPATVVVHLRESELAQWESSGQVFQVEVDPERQLRDRPAGEPQTVPVVLDASAFGRDATIQPSSVRVTASVTADIITREIKACPIYIATSFAKFGTRKAQAPDAGVLLNVPIWVKGPSELVNQLIGRDEKPRGYIPLRAEALEVLDTEQAFIPEFPLPFGIELDRPPEPVKLIIKEVFATGSERPSS